MRTAVVRAPAQQTAPAPLIPRQQPMCARANSWQWTPERPALERPALERLALERPALELPRAPSSPELPEPPEPSLAPALLERPRALAPARRALGHREQRRLEP